MPQNTHNIRQGFKWLLGALTSQPSAVTDGRGSGHKAWTQGWFADNSSKPNDGMLYLVRPDGTVIGPLGGDQIIVDLSADTSLGDEHISAILSCTGTHTQTLPTAVGRKAKSFWLINYGTGVTTVATTSAQTINGKTTWTMDNRYQFVRVTSDGANWFISMSSTF